MVKRTRWTEYLSWGYTQASLALLLMVYFVFYVWIILYDGVASDINQHNQILYTAIQERKFIIPPLYYYSVWFFGHLLFYHPSFKFGALVVLLFSLVSKYLLSIDFLSGTNPILSVHKKLYPLLGLSLLFFFPLIDPFWEGMYWYLGKFTPNIWHNSTSIVVLPFCLILYKLAKNWLENSGQGSLNGLFLVALLILLTKPSFLFVFIPTFPIAWILYHKKVDRSFWKTVGFSGFFFVCILLEKSLIYQENSFSTFVYSNSMDAKVGIKPFFVFLSLSQSIGWDLVSSFFFLLVACGLIWNELKTNPEFWWLLFLLLVGLIIYFVFVENGNRILDGNFYWQIPICLYLFNLFIINTLLNSKTTILKKRIIWTSYSLHVISGIAYLIHWVKTGYPQ